MNADFKGGGLDPREIERLARTPIANDPELDAFDAELRGERPTGQWEPRLVAGAFTRREPIAVGPWLLRPLTMQGWIDLEFAQSWFLVLGSVPDDDGQTMVRELAAAISVLSGEAVTPDLLSAVLSPELAASAVETVITMVSSAWATAMPMRPSDEKRKLETPKDDGFGRWLPTYSCLVAQCHIQPSEARLMDVAEALALIAGLRRNQNWVPIGPNYREKELALEAGE